MTEHINFGIYNGLEWSKLSTEYLHGLADMGNIQAQKELDKIYTSPIETQIVGFGKYIGYKWIDLDINYLYWIINNLDPDNIKYQTALKAIKYMQKSEMQEDDIDIIYVD